MKGVNFYTVFEYHVASSIDNEINYKQTHFITKFNLLRSSNQQRNDELD